MRNGQAEMTQGEGGPEGKPGGRPPRNGGEASGAAVHEACFLTVTELAEKLRIGRNHAYELVRRNEIPHIRLGNVIRIPRHAFEQWIADRTEGTGRGD